MKYCPQCSTNKSDESFSKNRARGDGLQAMCKDCQKAYDKKRWHGRSSDHYKKKKERRLGLIEKLRSYKADHPCIDCGESDPVVLEFDHVRGEKEANISDLLQVAASWSKIEAEIQKCDVRCANCHRRRTASQFDWH